MGMIKFKFKEILISLILIGTSVVWDYEKMGDWIRTGKMKWLFLSAAVYGGIKVADKWSKSVGAIFFSCLASFIWFNFPIFSSLDIFSLVACIFLIPLIFEINKESVINIILLACAGNSLVALAQLFGFHPFWPLGGSWVINPEMGFLGHPTMFGPLIVCGVACALYNGLAGNKKWLLLAAFFAVQTCLTASVMSVVSLGAVLITYLYFMSNKKWAFLLLFLSILSCVALELFVPRAMTDTGRMFWWKQAIGLIKESPLFGYGIGTWAAYAPLIAKKTGETSPVFSQMHNDYLQLFFELGLIGIGLLGWAFYEVIQNAVKAIKLDASDIRFFAIFVGLGINSFGNFPIRIAPLALLFGLSVYYFVNKKYLKEDQCHS